MMHIKLFLVCVSLSWLVTQHRSLNKLHIWLFERGFINTHNYPYIDATEEMYADRKGMKAEVCRTIYQFVTCSYCTGWWFGCIGSMFLMSSGVEVLLNGFISGLLSMTVCGLINKL